VTGRLFTKQHQQAITSAIAREGQATVEALCQLFDVSPATIRRDLDELDTQEVVIRTHGGAMRIAPALPELPVLQRGSDPVEAKRRLGKAAAALVPEGQLYLLRRGQPRGRSRAGEPGQPHGDHECAQYRLSARRRRGTKAA
jgi:DeoR/GlpR family transcriptional regulator of sugar metabolism